MSQSNKFPKQIRYIIGNEACERFSFYGMRSILVVFMVQYLLMSQSEAKGNYHLFVSVLYFLPVLGAMISDRFLGKYKTILYLSFFYCLGHGVLALEDSKRALLGGLVLIAIGAGGIKPCVSSHVGDQFTQKNQHLLKKVYELFYFSVNFGSFFATLMIPKLLKNYGPSVAFGVPGVLMAIAVFVFWMGRKQYVIVPPTGKENSVQFWKIIVHAIKNIGTRAPGAHWLDSGIQKFGAKRVEGAKAVINVFKVLVAVSAFWALFEQHGSSWVLQAKKMDLNFAGTLWEPSQIPALNPIMVMLLIPIFSLGVYPAVERLGVTLTPLRKIGAGMALTGLSFVAVAIIEQYLEAGVVVNVGWQFIPYIIITIAEVMVSITGLEFAYTQAPREMKSTVMSLWLLTVTLGNLFTAVVEYLNRFDGSGQFYFFAVTMFAVSGVFMWMASRYRYVNYVAPA